MRGAVRFWLAVLGTGIGAGMGAIVLTWHDRRWPALFMPLN